MSRGELLDEPLVRIAAALRGGEVGAEALIAAAIERHEAVGERLQAYQAWDAERARSDARAVDAVLRSGVSPGPLAGIPVSVKDLFGVEGYPTWAGTARRLPERWETEGSLVRTLRAQRAVITGKTKMVEMAFGGLGTNPHWGTPVNPWDATTDRVPGGSSSGAGVSLWEGSALVALGTDTACSIRTPASMTGTVGHKITHGRWPSDGAVPLSPTLDVVGALTRSVLDAAWVFAAVDGGQGAPERFLASIERDDLHGVRVGVGGTRVWEECPDDIADVVQEALRALESRGARLVEIDLPEFDAAYELYVGVATVAAECAGFVARELPEWMDLLHEIVGSRLRAAPATTSAEYRDALARRRELAAQADRRLRAFDVLATPTVPMTPPALAEVDRLEDYLRHNRMTSRATNPVNMLDLCAISLPCGLDGSGMPVGLQLVAPRGADEELLSVALQAERILGTARERIGAAPLGAVGRS